MGRRGAAAVTAGGTGTPLERLDEVVDLAPWFVAVLRGPDHVFEHVNPAYVRLVGQRDLIGQPVRLAMPEVVEQGFLDLLDGVFTSGEPYIGSEQPIEFCPPGSSDPDRRFVSFVYHPLRGDDDRVNGIAAHGIDLTEQVRARKALEEREQFYKSLIENSQDKITVLSPDGTIRYESPAAERVLGRGVDELVGTSVLDFVHPDDRGATRAQIASAVANPGRPHRLELRIRHRDGTWVLFETIGQARLTAQGVEIVTNSRDITAHRATEAERRVLVELMPQLVWSTTPDGYHDYFNQRWYDYTGMPRTGDQGWNWKDYLHPDDYDRSVEVWSRCLATGEPYEIEYRFRRASDGAYRWFIGRAHPLRGPEGEIVRWFGTCTDVHDERMALEAAERAQERYQAIAEATNDVVWDWDVEGGVVWRSENLQKVLGLDPASVRGAMDGWADHVHPNDRERATATFQATLDGSDRSWSDEYRLIRADGRVAHVLDRARILRDPDGRPVRMLGAVMDLTERIRLEGELRQAQKLEAIGRLAGGVAHDFNNILTVITNYSEILIEELADRPAQREDMEELRKSANRAASLTRQLLAFGRRQVFQPRDLDLNEVVSDMQKMLRRVIGETIELTFEPGEGLLPLYADAGQLEQVIMNLALNARDALVGGGTLTLRTASARLSTREARQKEVEPGDYILLTVADDGVGMDPDVLARAFEPFFTTKEPGHGTGLGLATVHGIVRQSGGCIEVESAPGEGTTFRIYLPACEGSAGPEAETTPQRARKGTGTVLLVEDEDAVRAIARRALTRYGYGVLEAGNGQEAAAVLEASPERIDLVLTDLVMPGMGGRQLADHLRTLPEPPPVLFMSGYAEAESLPGGDEGPGIGYLEKPFTIDQLVTAVRAAM